MSCPGGCIGGGGQPKTRGHDVLQKRMDAVYSIDSHAQLRKSHENPEVQVCMQAKCLGGCGISCIILAYANVWEVGYVAKH
jgi:iron only hydrogenase large subunit-like protein